MSRRRTELEHQASQLVRQILDTADRPAREQLINQHHGLRLKIEAMRQRWNYAIASD